MTSCSLVGVGTSWTQAGTLPHTIFNHRDFNYKEEATREQPETRESNIIRHDPGADWKVKMANQNPFDNLVVPDGGDNPPVAVMVPFDFDEDDGDNVVLLRGHMRHAAQHGRAADAISPLLCHMVEVGYTCTSLLSGWSRPDEHCTRRVEHCQENPDQAFFMSPHTGRTPLHEACLRNACIHVIRALLAANRLGAAERDHRGNTPLHLLFIPHSPMSLTSDEMVAIVEALLESSPSQLANATNSAGNTALLIACSSPEPTFYPAVFTTLLAANPACASTLNNLSQAPLHVYCRQPPTRTLIESTQILFNAYPDAAILQDVGGRTPLHHAAAKLNTELICFLVDRAPHSAVIRSGPQSETALHVFCQQNPREQHLPALQALLEAAPDAVTIADSFASSPLHILCKNKKPLLDMIRLLVETNPGVASMTDSEGYTALHHACENEADMDVIECLLNAYKEAALVVSKKQDTALHIACSANASSETVRLLIEASPDALTKTNDYGFTPLHCVCRAYIPRAGIVQAIIEACPDCVAIRTHGGETAMHLACSSGAYVGVLRLLVDSQSFLADHVDSSLPYYSRLSKSMTNKIGNTPLHEACFRGAGFEHIETLATSNPEWIVTQNNAGYTPLQILCKRGRLDERVVTTFSRIRGPEVFTVVDQTGHTPLHSACRDGTEVAAIKSLIRAFPDALMLKTLYGDTPLHLACLRSANVDVVRLIAESSSVRRLSPLLEPNGAGQTPIGIAMEAFQSPPSRGQAFEVLAMLVKLLFYGVFYEEDWLRPPNLVRACVSLHRQDVRLDPAFIRRVIELHPEDIWSIDEDGNYPLHIEASVPIEKMSILDSSIKAESCHTRVGILEILLEAYPEALCVRNVAGEFPLGLMIQNGRPWSHAFALSLRTFPAALHWYHGGIKEPILPHVLYKVSSECGTDSLFQLLVSRPSIVRRRPSYIP